MTIYDLCLTWVWPYDRDFVELIGQGCTKRGLTLWQVNSANLLEAVTGLYGGGDTFHTLLDRAAEDLRFEPVRRFARDRKLDRINPSERSHWAEDKATMHLELIQAGLQTPYTILMAPFIDAPVIPGLDLTPLGANFVMKPAVGGGGEGVKMGASTLLDVQRARLDFPAQKYLAQAHVVPRLLSGRLAWFRAFHVAGESFLCWWHPTSHVYAQLTAGEEQALGLAALREVVERIAQVCKLDWFSTEIALTEDGRFVVVDYVNDGIDTRLQSKAADGVPDALLASMANRLVERAASRHAG
jgi:hypothetical protein